MQEWVGASEIFEESRNRSQRRTDQATSNNDSGISAGKFYLKNDYVLSSKLSLRQNYNHFVEKSKYHSFKIIISSSKFEIRHVHTKIQIFFL